MAVKFEKSVSIAAPLEKVRSHILDFHLWKKWSPWSVLDSDQKCDISGEAGALNSRMSWEGKFAGSATVALTSVEEKKIVYKLEFHKPWRLKADTSFHFDSSNGSTKLAWKMESKLPFFLFFLSHIVQTTKSMDCGRGLNMLKHLLEKGSIDAKTVYQGIVDFEGFSYIGRKSTSSVEEIPKYMSEDFRHIMGDCHRLGKKYQHCLAVYTKNNMRTGEMTYVSAISDENFKGVQLDSSYERGQIPTQKMLEVKHHGSYNFLGNAWAMGASAVHANKLKGNGFPFEYYHNDPRTTAESDLLTSIFFPIKN